MTERLSYEEVNRLSAAALAQLITEQKYTLADVQAYKDEADTVGRTNPVVGEQIAQAAYRVGQLLPPPAPALGAWALGKEAIGLTQFSRAIPLLRSARAGYLAIGDELNAARLSGGLVGALAFMLDADYMAEATAIVEESAPILTRLAETDGQERFRLAALYSNFAAGFLRIGEHSTAIGYYDRALSIIEIERDPVLQTAPLLYGTLLTRGLSYILVNLFQAAEDDLQMAVAGFEQLGGNAFQHGLALYNMGILEQKRGNYAVSDEWFDQAITLFEAIGDGWHQIADHYAYVQLYRAHNWLTWQSGNEETDRWLNEAGAFFRAHERLIDVGRVLILQNIAHQQKGDWAAARQRLAAAADISQRYGGHLLAWRIHTQFAQLALDEAGDETTAIQQLYRALDAIESARERLTIEAQRTAVMQDKSAVYIELAQLLLKQDATGEALSVLERGRARVLAERLEDRLAQDVASATDDAKDEAVQSLAQQIQTLMEQLAEAQRRLYRSERPSAGQDGERLTAAHAMETVRKSMGIHRQMLRYVREIQYKRPRFARLSTIHPVTLNTVAQTLDAETVLLFYQTMGTEVHGFLLDHTGRIVHRPLCSAEMIETAVHQFNSQRRQLWKVVEADIPLPAAMTQMLLREPNAVLHQLHTALLTPFADKMAMANHLVVIPDGQLFSVPFQALFDGEQYLIEQKSVSYCPSLTFLDLCRRGNNRPDAEPLLAMGYDGHDRSRHLTHVHDEIEAVHTLFGEGVTRTDQSATAHWFLQHAHRFNIIHIGSHATYMPTAPHLSFITLADRDLTSAEIAGLHLNARLVTLSGCETARTESNGNEFISISGAFGAAGVPTLLVSQWVVGDLIASEMMRLFYEAVLAGVPVGRALQAAQQTVITTSRHSEDATIQQHPALWSPFIIVGDWTQII